MANWECENEQRRHKSLQDSSTWAPADARISCTSPVAQSGITSKNDVSVRGSDNPSHKPAVKSLTPSKRPVQKWTDAEKASFLYYFARHGKNWATLKDLIPSKTEAQIKNYYQNYKNRLGLQQILTRWETVCGFSALAAKESDSIDSLSTTFLDESPASTNQDSRLPSKSENAITFQRGGAAT